MNAAVETLKQPPSIYTHINRLLGTRIRTEADAVREVTRGLPARSYRKLAETLGLSGSMLIPESTLRRRLQDNARFTEAESERLLRVARIYAEAVQLFGDETRALDWLNTDQDWIPGQAPMTPLTLSTKDSGARLLESRLRQTAYGIF